MTQEQDKESAQPVALLIRADGEAHHSVASIDHEVADLWIDEQRRFGAPYEFTVEPLYAAPQPTPAEPAAPPMQGEMKIIQEAIDRVGIKSLLNHGAGSLVWSEGVEGVTQDDLLAYTREVALHCAVALAAPQPNAALADGWQASLPDVEDMAHGALEEALSFGVSHGVFHRWMHAVREQTVAAMCNTAPPTLNASKEAGHA